MQRQSDGGIYEDASSCSPTGQRRAMALAGDTYLPIAGVRWRLDV